MSYTHLTKREHIFIEIYHETGMKGHPIAQKIQRGPETIYRVIRQLKAGKSAIEIYDEYKKTNKSVVVNPFNFLKTKWITSMRK